MFQLKSKLSFKQLSCVFWAIFWRSILLIILGISVTMLLFTKGITAVPFFPVIVFSIILFSSIIGFIYGITATHKDFSIEATTLTGVKLIKQLSFMQKFSLWWSYEWRVCICMFLLNFISSFLWKVIISLNLNHDMYMFNIIKNSIYLSFQILVHILIIDNILVLKKKRFSIKVIK